MSQQEEQRRLGCAVRVWHEGHDGGKKTSRNLLPNRQEKRIMSSLYPITAKR
jgi:hypothetical protein